MRQDGTGCLTSVPKRRPICESDLERVFDVPGSCLFRSEVVAPDGTVRVFDGIRAYVDSVEVGSDGRVSISVKSKSSNIRSGKVPYPYNFFCGDKVLCMMKLNEMRMKSDEDVSTFGITYSLFCLPWAACVVLHVARGEGHFATVTGRGEWERGELNSHNQEVQMFLSVPRARQVPVGMLRPMVSDGMARWMDDCEKEMGRKGL